MSRLWSTEPALVIAAVTAVLAALVSFGVAISADQSAALIGLVGAALALAAGLVTRTQVTPTDAP